jgi:hypothetical protein
MNVDKQKYIKDFVAFTKYIMSNKSTAIEFLIRANIYTADGKLSDKYKK